MGKLKALLIAEKPSLMREIKLAYEHHKNEIEYDIDFIAQVGHLMELYDPVEINPIYKSWNPEYLPIDPKKEGGWKYKVKKNTKDIYESIETAVKTGKYDVIIHAGDADQEGELLIRLVLEKISNKLPVLRFWANDTTETTLFNALRNLKEDSLETYQNLYNSALIRQHADWLFGMNGSRAIAGRLYAGKENKIAAGRVMTWVQTIIVDREDEIKNFVPKTSYGVKVDFNTGNDILSGNLYETSLEKEDETAGFIYFETKTEALDILNNLTGPGKVISVDKSRVTTYAPKLYKLATIQSEAARYGYSSGKTLELIQSLYEKRIVTYPRTDCEVLSPNENFNAMIEAASTVPGFEEAGKYAKTKIKTIINTKKYVNEKELQKHGHSALVPTTEIPNLEALTNDELTIYKIIAKRFLAIFQPPLLQDKTVIITESDNYAFRTSGKIVVDKGYTEFTGSDIKNIDIPDVKEGDILTINNKSIVEKITTCPKRFTDGTIIDAMEKPAKYLSDPTIKNVVEDISIGTPATRGAIIEKLVDDKYIERKGGELVPTDFSIFMIHAIRGISICRADTTGEWEQTLQKVRSGEISYEEAEEYVYTQLYKLIKDTEGINKLSYGNAGPSREPIAVCPCCGKNIYESSVNYFCEGYRDGCKASIKKDVFGVKYSKEEAIKLFNGKEIEKTFVSKEGKKYKQKVKFDPNAQWNPVRVQAEAIETNIACPECKSHITIKGNIASCECGFKTWINLSGKLLTEEELGYIFTHGKSKGKIKGFISKKTGKAFEAKLKLNCDKENSRIEFDFT